MKLAFMISMALILPIFAAYFVVEATQTIPLQIELNEELSLNDSINSRITHHTQDIELGYQKNCRSGIVNIHRAIQCNV